MFSVGDISSRYGSDNQVGSTLNERLQLWRACGATRILLDINTQCMSCLMHSNTETCINALLRMLINELRELTRKSNYCEYIRKI